MKRNGPLVAWMVDDPGFPKKGTHSVGVVRQYCGQVGKQENCRVAVSLSVATEQASLPIAWRLYLPEIWAQDGKRRKEAGIPKELSFATKPTIALQQIRKAIEEEITPAPVLADAAYGNDSQFREGLTALRLAYIVGVQGPMSVWRCGEAPLSAKRWKGLGRPPKLLRRDKQHRPISVKQLAESLAANAWENASWREGTKPRLRSRFAALRVRVAHGDNGRSERRAAEWLLIEWPTGASEATKYWLSTLPAASQLVDRVKLAKHRWIMERDYEELQQELGLAHYEGRGWRGFHHHGTLCIAAYGFLVAERSRSPPLCSSRSAGTTHPENSARLPSPRLVAFAPSGIIRTRSLHSGYVSLAFCCDG